MPGLDPGIHQKAKAGRKPGFLLKAANIRLTCSLFVQKIHVLRAKTRHVG
jgi:hypothetical protein